MKTYIVITASSSPVSRIFLQVPHAVTGLLDHDDGTLIESGPRISQDFAKAVNDMFASRVSEPKDDDAHRPLLGERDDFPEIEVKGQDDSFFCLGLFEDGPIRQPLEVLIPKMGRIMALGAKPLNHPLGHSHVGEKTHPGLPGVYFFLHDPGGIFEGRLHILCLQVRVVR